MEVTSKNFKTVLPIILNSIKKADFIAIDTEFTGLTNDLYKPNAFDTPSDRYEKLRIGSMNFMVVQFGISIFRYDASDEQYMSQIYNFYVFPSPSHHNIKNQTFECQSSCIDFLASQNFDFNKTFSEGIPFMRTKEYESAVSNIVEKHDKLMETSSIESTSRINSFTIHENQIEFIESIYKKIDIFIDSPDKQIELETLNEYQRKCIHNALPEKYGSKFFIDTRMSADKKRTIFVKKVDGSNPQNMLEMKKECQLEKLSDAHGFSQIIKALSESEKMIIGHNMLYDILHMFHKFYCVLPDDYEEFKHDIKSVFPYLIDTKVLASSYPLNERLKDTSLVSMYDSLMLKPFDNPKIAPPEEYVNFDNNHANLHEAGYDAYLTGVSFIAMISHLGKLDKAATVYVTPSSSLLKPFLNKIFLLWVSDIPYMNLHGDELNPSREHVFHITFPEYWNQQNIYSLFYPYGGVKFIGWIDKTSAYISLNNKSKAEPVRKKLSRSAGSVDYRIIPYKVYKQMENSNDLTLKRKLVDCDTYSTHKNPKSEEKSQSNEYINAGATTSGENEAMSISSENNGSDSHNSTKKNAINPSDKVFSEDDTW